MPRKLLADSYRGWYGWEGQHNSMLRMSNNMVWECQHKMDLERFRHQIKMHQLEASQACREVSARRAYHSLQDEYHRIRAEQAVLQTHAFTSYDPSHASRPRTDKPVPSAKARIRGKRRPKTERFPNQPPEFNDKQFKRNSLPSIGSAEISTMKERKRPEEKLMSTASRERDSSWNPPSPAEVTTLVELERRKKAAPKTTTTKSRKQSTIASSKRGPAHLTESDIMTSAVLEVNEEDNGGGVDGEGDDDVFYESDALNHSTAGLVSGSDKHSAERHPYQSDVSADMTVETGAVDESLGDMRLLEDRPGREPSEDSFQRIEFILDTKKNPTRESSNLSSTYYVKPSTPTSTTRPFSLTQTKDAHLPHDVTKTLGKGDSPIIRTRSPREVSHGGVYLTKLEPSNTSSDNVTLTVRGKDGERSSLLHARVDVKNSGAHSPARTKHEKRAEVLRSSRPGSLPNPKLPEKPTHRPRTEVRQNVLAPLPTTSTPSKRSVVRPSLLTDDPTAGNQTAGEHHSKPGATVVSPRQHHVSPPLKPVHAPNFPTPANNNHNDSDDKKPEATAMLLQRQPLSPRSNPVQVSNAHTSGSGSGSGNKPNNNNDGNSDSTVTPLPKQSSPRPKTLENSNAVSSDHDATNGSNQEGQQDVRSVAPGFRLAKFRKAAEMIIEEKRVERETNMSVFAALFMHKVERQQLKLRPLEKPACVQEQEDRNMWQELLLNVQSAVRWKAKILREKEGILNTRQMRKKAHEDQQAREKSRRHVFPGHCKTTYAMKKFLSKEIDDLVEAWRPENVRKHRNKQLMQRASLPEFVDRTRSTTAILKEFKSYQSKHGDVGAR